MDTRNPHEKDFLARARFSKDDQPLKDRETLPESNPADKPPDKGSPLPPLPAPPKKGPLTDPEGRKVTRKKIMDQPRAQLEEKGAIRGGTFPPEGLLKVDREVVPKHIEIEWEPVGNLYEIYWDDEEKLYDRRGPLLYCAYVQMTSAVQNLLQAKHLAEWRDATGRKKGTNDEARMTRLFTQLEQKKPAKETLFLLYIGKLGQGKTASLGTRLFESHDPASNFCTYALRASPEWIMIAVADCTKQVKNEIELEFLEACEIFKHEPPLNLRIKMPDPSLMREPDPSEIKPIWITNKWKVMPKKSTPSVQTLLKQEIYP